MIAGATLQLAGQRIGLGHSQPRPLAAQQGDTGGGIADERDPALRPAVHANLANAVEVEFPGLIQLRQN